MMFIPSLTDVLKQEIDRAIQALDSSLVSSKFVILDVGAGSGGYWAEIAPALSLKYPSMFFELHLLDAHTEFSNSLLVHNRPSFIVRQHQFDFDNMSFSLSDLVSDKAKGASLLVCCDVLEHLRKSSGWKLLYEFDNFMAEYQFAKAILVTPNGFVYQPPSLDNSHNAHVSSWEPKELKKAGYKMTKGLTQANIAVLNNLRSSRRLWIRVAGELVTRAFLFFPKFAHEILYVKKSTVSQRTSFAPSEDQPSTNRVQHDQ